jgi:hypothetical protein
MRIQSGSNQNQITLKQESSSQETNQKSASTSVKSTSDTFERSRTSTVDSLIKTNQDLINVSNRIDAGRLSHLKEKIEGVGDTEIQKNKLKELIGEGASAGTGNVSHLGQIRSSNGTRDRAGELIGLPGGGVAGFRNQQVSDDDKDAKEESSLKSGLKAIWEYGRDLVLGATKTKTGGAASFVVGTANTILTANTDSPESKADEFRGWATLFRMRDGKEMERRINENIDKTPVPDRDENTPEHLTPESIRHIRAEMGALIDPSPQAEETSNGGPVNPGATTAGNISMAAEYVNDLTGSVARVITSADLKAIEARLGGKMKIIG